MIRNRFRTIRRNLVLSLAFITMVLSFQNCGPSNGFSALQYTENSSSSSGDPNAPLDPSSLKECGTTLAPGESCFVAIQFSPKTKGPHVGSMKIHSDDGTLLGEVALSGQGQ